MISKENMKYINNAIKVYNKLVDKVYLLCFNSNIREPLNFVEIQITERNFWHLAGCKIDSNIIDTYSQKRQLYQDCLDGKDISSCLIYTDSPNDIKIKCLTLQKIFDFISNAKILKIQIQSEHLNNLCLL